MDADQLCEVNGQVGTLVLDLKGHVLSSTGELSGEAGENAGEIIFSMLQDSSSVLDVSKSEELERMIVTFPTYDFAVTLDAKQIYVVKRATAESQE